MTVRPAPNRRAAIVAPVRTPVGTFGGGLRAVPVEELAATAIKAVLERTGIDPEIIDDVSFAQGYVNGETPCIARWAALAADLPISVPGLPDRPPLRRRAAGGRRRGDDGADRRGRRGGGRRRREHEQRRVLHDLECAGAPGPGTGDLHDRLAAAG